LTLQGRNNNANQKIIKATLDIVEKHGFYLMHTAMDEMLLIAMTDQAPNRAQRVTSHPSPRSSSPAPNRPA
jgi:hypothetical protein